MLYVLEQGPTEKQILEACYARGVMPPESIQNAPELLPALDMYYDAYVTLGTCRTDNGQIPWTAMCMYADKMGLKAEGFDRFIYLLKEMDYERTGFLAKQNK